MYTVYGVLCLIITTQAASQHLPAASGTPLFLWKRPRQWDGARVAWCCHVKTYQKLVKTSVLDLEMIVKCQYIQGEGCRQLSVIRESRQVLLCSGSIKVRSIFISVMMGPDLLGWCRVTARARPWWPWCSRERFIHQWTRWELTGDHQQYFN